MINLDFACEPERLKICFNLQLPKLTKIFLVVSRHPPLLCVIVTAL